MSYRGPLDRKHPREPARGDRWFGVVEYRARVTVEGEVVAFGPTRSDYETAWRDGVEIAWEWRHVRGYWSRRVEHGVDRRTRD